MKLRWPRVFSVEPGPGGRAVTRAAIYARYSSDMQNERSIEDQIELCRAYAERRGLAVTAVYDDRAISGASTVQRLGWRRLMGDAADRRFDVLIAEDVDRISRDEADYHGAKKRLTFLGVEIHTAHTGPISGIEGSVRAMMASYFLENLAHKVRRGQAGVIRSGRHAGGRAYGYRPVHGKPGELTIVEAEAEVVRRICRSYCDGRSPRDIAGDLNREGIAPPRGAVWNGSTINGSRQRGTGILGNELYRGRLVWNRVRMVKDPDTGRRISRVNPDKDWQIVEVPELVIIGPELAAAVDARRGERRATPRQATRPRHLLSGVLKCGACGSGMVVKDRDRSGRLRVRCSRHTESGACDHSRVYYLSAIEEEVLGGLRDELQHPVLIRRYIDAYQDERRRLARQAASSRGKTEQKLGETNRAIGRLVEALASGLASAEAVREKLLALEAEKNALQASLLEAPKETVIALHPKAIAFYLSQIEHLANSLGRDKDLASSEIADAFRRLVQRVVVHPVVPRAPLDIEIVGRLGELLAAAGAKDTNRQGLVWGSGGSGGGTHTPPHTDGLTFSLRSRARAA